MKKHTKFLILTLVMAVFCMLFASCGKPGPKGDPGAKGEQGIPGTNGTDGVDGKSAYELAVAEGFVGSIDDWLQSLEGTDGDKGDKGETGNTPKLRVNETTNMWEISYDSGLTYTSLEVKATGDKGEIGNDGISPKLQINSETNKWEISYDNGTTWIKLGVQATGDKGDKGDKGETGIAPKLRVNETTNMWEVSYDNGTTWTNLNIQATGNKGDNGDKGDTGKSAYDMYVEKNPEYVGTEEDWLHDVINGTLTKYTVTFNLNGGVAGSDFVASIEVGCGKNIALTTPTKVGYTFMGWYTGEGINDGIFTITSVVTGNLDLIARWRINQLTVTFFDYYGDTAKIETVDYGASAQAPALPTQITEEKVYFDGWDKSFDNVTSDITVNALYSHRIYKVTYNTDSATVIPEQNVYFGELPTKPIDPEKLDFWFDGWYLDDEYTIEYNFDIAFNKDTVIYAKMSEYITIRTAEDLIAISNASGRKYMLANDINLEGNLWTPIYSFSGVLDGAGYKIKNFAISSTDSTVGFVSYNYGTIKNIVFENVGFSYTNSFTYSNSNLSAGVIAGNNSGTIENCNLINGSIMFDVSSPNSNNKTYLGALVGQNSGTVRKCGNCIDVVSKLNNINNKQYLYAYISLGVGYNSGNIEQINVYGDVLCDAYTG